MKSVLNQTALSR